MASKAPPTSYVAIYDVSEYAVVVLVKKALENTTFIFHIHKFSSTLDFSNLQNHSIFDTRAEAESYIHSFYPSATKILAGVALVGFSRFGSRSCLIIITECENICTVLGSHNIFLVKATKFFWFDSPLFPPLDAQELRRVSRIEEFPLAGFHMWCETHDFTAPIGFPKHQPELVWNTFLSEPFTALGRRDCCVTLLQGTASSQSLSMNSETYKISIITLRSSSHAGTRYYSRGLNAEASPANEVQCELIIEDESGITTSNVWRRGTVPVKWRTIQNAALPTTSFEILDNFAELTPKYFAKLRNQYSSKVLCMNLLHNGEGQSEKPLCDAFRSSIASEKDVAYSEFDWHEKKKELGTMKAVEELWSEIKSKMELTFTKSSPNGEVYETQRTIIRINCMDSLDRTNVGCFFYVVLIFLYQFKDHRQGLSAEMIDEIEVSLRKFLASSFIDIGDTISFLYTNTPACMTSIFSEFGKIENKNSSDSAIAMQRRYQNFVKDKLRNKSISIFLGQDLEKMLPRLDYSTRLMCISSSPINIIYPEFSSDSDLFSFTSIFTYKTSYASLDPTSMSVVLVLLRVPSYVSSVLIATATEGSPISVELEGGFSATSLRPLCSKFALPRAVGRTNHFLIIPPDISNGSGVLCKILRLTFESATKRLNLSNIFVFGSSSDSCFVEIFPTVYNKMTNKADGKWPTIEDSSPLRTVVSQINDVSLESFATVELARLHHRQSRLDTAAVLASYGKNPNDFNISNFSQKMVKLPASSLQNCVSCQSQATWKCSACMKQFCEKCGKMAQYSNPFFTDGSVNLCGACADEFKKKECSLENLCRFYRCYSRLHFPDQYQATEWYLSLDKDVNSGPFEFPRASFIYSDDPKNNLVLMPCGGCMEVAGSYRFVLGVPSIVTKFTIESSDDCQVEFQVPNCTTSVAINAAASRCEKCNLMFAYSISLNIKQGKLFKIVMEGYPQIDCFTNATVAKSDLSFETITAKKAVSVKELTTTFQLGKIADIHGLALEKCAGISAIIALFFGDGDFPKDTEQFYLPLMVGDSYIQFSSQKSATSVKVIIYDHTDSFTSGKIALF